MMMEMDILKDLERMTDFVVRIETEVAQLKAIIDMQKNKLSTISILRAGGGDGDNATGLKTATLHVPVPTIINDANKKSSKTATATTTTTSTGPMTRLKRNSSRSQVDENPETTNNKASISNCPAPTSIVGHKEITAKQPLLPQTSTLTTEIIPQTSLPLPASTLLEQQDVQPTEFPPTISIVEVPKTPPFTDSNLDSNGPFDFLADLNFDSFIATPTEMCIDSTVKAIQGASYYLLKDTENTAIQLAEYINQQRQGELTIDNILDQVWTTKLPEEFQLEDGELPDDGLETPPPSLVSDSKPKDQPFILDKEKIKTSSLVNVSKPKDQPLILHKDKRSKWEALGRRKISPKIPQSNLSAPTSEIYQSPRKSLRIHNKSPRKMTPVKVTPKKTPKKSPRKRKNTPKKRQENTAKNPRRSLFEESPSKLDETRVEDKSKRNQLQTQSLEKRMIETESFKPPSKHSKLSETRVEDKSKKTQLQTQRPEKRMIETESFKPPSKHSKLSETRVEDKSKKNQLQTQRPEKRMIETDSFKQPIPKKVVVPSEVKATLPPPPKRPKLNLSPTEIILHISPIKPIVQPHQKPKIESTPPKKNALLNFFKIN